MVKDKKREEFIKNNLRLVSSLCKRFSGRGIEYEDIYQAGCVGLVKAADAFDENLGFCFSTYAVPVILGEMRRLFRDGGSVKVSRSIKELSIKVLKKKSELEYKLSREPTISEIAADLGVKADSVIEAMDAAQPALSLTSVNEDGEYQTDVPIISQERQLEDSILIDSAISKLDKREQTIIKLRFFEQLTQSETAKRLSMTQVAVSRAEKKILIKLRSIIGSVA